MVDGVVILDENGVGHYLVAPRIMSPNMVDGPRALIRLGRKNIVVQSDSQLLVRQLNGEYRLKDEKLKELFQRAVSLLRQFDSYRIVHVRREFNKLADRMANRGIDEAVKRNIAG
jgi:ribonuclease HI